MDFDHLTAEEIFVFMVKHRLWRNGYLCLLAKHLIEFNSLNWDMIDKSPKDLKEFWEKEQR